MIFYLYVYKDRLLKLIENLRKWLNFILVIIKLIWFFFGEMYFKLCYCIFYLVYVVFIDFKVEKIFEFFFERLYFGVFGLMYV